MDIQRVAGALGAEISGIDLSRPLDSATQAELRQALNEHEVIFFRDQDISPAVQRDLGLIFGPLQTHPAYGTLDNLPEVMILESTAEKPSKIEVWHTDMTFKQHPPSVTVLKGIDIPPVGGDTLFASMTAAYNALSAGMKNYLKDLVAVHDFSQGFKESLTEPGGRERLAEAVAVNPPVKHPVIQTHPETGRPIIFVNALFTSHIINLPPMESVSILDFLYRHCTQVEFTCRFKWQVNSIAIWDNRSTLHKPVNDFLPATRRLHRVVSEGDHPY